MFLMINVYDCFQTLKYWVFIILFIRQINSRISLFKFQSIFVKKRDKYIFHFTENYLKSFLQIYFIFGTTYCSFFNADLIPLELFDKIIIHLKALYGSSFVVCDIFFNCFFNFIVLDFFWVLLDNKLIKNLCVLIL